MMNQVSKDSPFKRYKIKGVQNSSSEDEEPQISTDDFATFNRVEASPRRENHSPSKARSFAD